MSDLPVDAFMLLPPRQFDYWLRVFDPAGDRIYSPEQVRAAFEAYEAADQLPVTEGSMDLCKA